MIRPAEPLSDESPKSTALPRAAAMPTMMATPAVVAIATPARNPRETRTAFGAVTKMMADMI